MTDIVERLHAEYGRQIANLEKHLDAETADNERLRAQNTELLAALRDARTWLSWSRSAIDDSTERADFELVMDRIHAAIAKAEKP
jgi:predicted ATPase